MKDTLDTIVIRCKGCGAMFYATSRLRPRDVLEIVEIAKEGHEVICVDSESVCLEFQECFCGGIQD